MVDSLLQRNKERHGQDKETREQHMKVMLRARLEELYSHRPDIMRVDYDIFPYGSAQEHLMAEPSLDVIQDWCLDHGPAIEASCKQAKALGITGTGDIRLYLQAPTRMTDSTQAVVMPDGS